MENQNAGAPPKNYLVESILVTIFCCLPFGIVGIINANKVNTLHAQGDMAGAEQAAADAKKWTKIGFIIGLVVLVLYVLWIFLFAGAFFTAATAAASNMDALQEAAREAGNQ